MDEKIQTLSNNWVQPNSDLETLFIYQIFRVWKTKDHHKQLMYPHTCICSSPNCLLPLTLRLLIVTIVVFMGWVTLKACQAH